MTSETDHTTEASFKSLLSDFHTKQKSAETIEYLGTEEKMHSNVQNSGFQNQAVQPLKTKTCLCATPHHWLHESIKLGPDLAKSVFFPCFTYIILRSNNSLIHKS